jgi:hypothetical protein
MNHTASSILGEAAYLKRSCELLLDRLKGVEALVFGTEQLTPMQEGEVANANQRWAEGAKEHVELANQHLRDWHDALNEALSMVPYRLR